MKAQAWRLEVANYPRRITLQTRYGDMDTNAHLNNSAIARLVEETRIRVLGTLVVDADPRGVMIAHVSIDYLAEGRYPADVEAGFAIVELGNASYRLGIGLFQQGAPFALADCVMVNLGDGRRPAPMGAPLRAALEALHHG